MIDWDEELKDLVERIENASQGDVIYYQTAEQLRQAMEILQRPITKEDFRDWLCNYIDENEQYRPQPPPRRNPMNIRNLLDKKVPIFPHALLIGLIAATIFYLLGTLVGDLIS